MRVSLLVLVAFTGCRNDAPRSAPDPRLEARREAFDALMTLSGLDSAQLGAIGAVSSTAQAFRVILAAPDAEARFSELTDRGSTEGRLLGLCGLKVIGSARFAGALKAFSPQHGELEGMQGCIVGTSRKVTDVLADISGGGLCEDYAGVPTPQKW